MAVDISTLPPPPPKKEKKKGISIEDLPPPPPSLTEAQPAAKEEGRTVVESLPPPPPPKEKDAIQEEIEKRSFFDRPVLGAEYTKKEEVEAIANRYGVDPKALIELAPYYGARLEGEEFFSKAEAKRALGGVGQVLFNVPQKLYKISQDPQMEKALDEVQQLAGGRSSYAQLAGEIAIPVGEVKAAGSALSTAAKLAGMGAVQGAANAVKGEELTGAAIGAAATAGIGTLANQVIKRLSSKATKVVQEGAEEIASDLPKSEQKMIRETLLDPKTTADIETGIKQIASSREASEAIIEKKLLETGDRVRLSPQEIDVIVNEHYSPEALQKLLAKADEVPERLPDDTTPFLKELQKVVPEDSPDAALLRKAVEEQGLPPDVKELKAKLAYEVLRTRTDDILTKVGEKPAQSFSNSRRILQSWAKNQGGDAAIKMENGLLKNETAALEYINEKAISLGRTDNFGEQVKNFISDAQFVLRDIGRRYQLPLEVVHQKLNKVANRMSFPRLTHRKEINDIYRFAAKQGLDKELSQGIKIYNAIDTGDLSRLSEKELAAAEKVKKFFNDAIDFVNGKLVEKDPDITPLSIEKLKDYIPHLRKSTPDLIIAFERKQAEFLEEASQVLNKNFTDIRQVTPDDFQRLSLRAQDLKSKGIATATDDFLLGLKAVEAGNVRDGNQIYKAFRDTFGTKEGRFKLESKATSAFERTGDIPLFMRETNIYKLMDAWSQNTLKHVYLRQGLGELRSMARMVKAAGGEQESRYINNLITDIIGIRAGTAAEYALTLKANYLTSVIKMERNAKNPISKAAAVVLKSLPYIFEDLNKQLYPNLLGASPRAIIQNFTQVWTKTAPELGTRYGMTAVFRGIIHASLNFKQQYQKILELGFQPSEFIPAYNKATADGIRRSSLYAVPMDIVQKLGDTAMIVFTKMDAMNRMIATSTAEMMAHDLAKPGGLTKRLAQKGLSNFPDDVQRAVASAKSTQEVGSILATHLNAATQYNYNRMSMSEYGRIMGPFFSTFSKWPTATAGEIIDGYRKRGAFGGSVEFAKKFFLPYAMFKMADYVLSGTTDAEERSDRYKRLVGSEGFAGTAPLKSPVGILTGEFFTPPAIDALMSSVVLPVFRQGKPIDPLVGLGNAVGQFTPGAAYVRFLTDDLVTIVTGERPEGSEFVSRSIEGFRRLTK